MTTLYGKLNKTVEALKLYQGISSPTASTTVDNTANNISVAVKKVPNKLILTQGEVHAEYDGSREIELELPTADALSALQQTVAELSSSVTGLETALSNKQDKNIKFTDVTIPVATWVEDSTYLNYPYKATLYFENVSADMLGFMLLSADQAITGNYLSIINVNNGSIDVWSKVNEELIIPTLLFVK